MKNVTIILLLILFIPQTIWGNELNFNYSSHYLPVEMNYNDYAYSYPCEQSEQMVALNTSISVSQKQTCSFVDGFTENSFMFNYHLNENSRNLAITYNTLSIGVTIDTKSIDLGNGQQVTVYKPRLKADLSGDIEPGYFFTDWKVTVNSTSIRKLHERHLPVDPMMRNMFYDSVYRDTFNGNKLRGRVIFLEFKLHY